MTTRTTSPIIAIWVKVVPCLEIDFVFVVSLLPDLSGCLAVDTGPAAERADGVVNGRAVNAVPLPRLRSHDEDRDARDAHAEEAAEDVVPPAHVLCIFLDEPTPTAPPKQAHIAVAKAKGFLAKAATDLLLPLA